MSQVAPDAGFETLNVPVSEAEFKDRLMRVAEARDFEVTFTTSKLNAPDGCVWVSTYGMSNLFVDDEVQEREAAELRRLCEALDVETIDADEANRDCIRFGVTVPTPTDPEWESFKQTIGEVTGESEPDVYFTVKVIDRYERVEIGCSYGYERLSQRDAKQALDRVAEELRDRVDADIGEPNFDLGFATLRVER